MKKMNLNKWMLLLFILSFIGINNALLAQDDSIPAVPIVKLHYFNKNNSMQYLLLESTLKRGKVFTPQKGKTYDIYLDSSNANNLIGQVQTDENGKAKVFLPPSVKAAWDAKPQHTFIVNEAAEEVISDYIITKSKITLDTTSTDEVRSITVTVMQFEKNAWVPAKDVEMKVGIQRLGGILSAGDEQTYTTDSSGTVTVELKKTQLPGDKDGNMTLVAKVEDNETLGNLLVEKSTPWGIAIKEDTDFFSKRTLWATQFRSPYWLLFLAYSIIIGVWGTLFYLFVQLRKIIKLGAN